MSMDNQLTNLPSRDAVIGYFGGEFRKALEALPDDILVLTLDELEARRQPQENDYLLRRNFWREVEFAKKSGGTDIQMVAVYGSVCSRQAFDKLLSNSLRLAWILIPPLSDIDRMRGILNIALGRLSRGITVMEVNEKTLGNYLKAVELLMNRVHGPIIQKIDARHAHLNMNKPIEAFNPEDALKKIENLKAQIEQREVKEIYTTDAGGVSEGAE